MFPSAQGFNARSHPWTIVDGQGIADLVDCMLQIGHEVELAQRARSVFSAACAADETPAAPKASSSIAKRVKAERCIGGEKLGFAKGVDHPANATAYGKAPASRTGAIPLIELNDLPSPAAYAAEPK